MKRIVVLGDVHGYDAIPILEHWKDADSVILLGDYLDSYDDINPIDQIANAKRIFEYVDEHPNMVTLLGNHELHYLIDYEQSSRQFRHQAYDEACLLMRLRYYAGKFQTMIEDHRIMFSHAGVTNTWIKKRYVPTGDNHEAILKSLSYYDGDTSGFGASIYQSPCWVRPSWSIPQTYRQYFSFLEYDPYYQADYQFVGHSRCKQITMDDNNIIFCDCLKSEHALIELEDDGDVRIYGINSTTFDKRVIL